VEIKKVSINDVNLWKDNPRNIKTADFKRLKKQIEELGVYKPLIACPENGGYTILGGNMRLRALKDMGLKEVDMSIVKPKSKAEKIKYALSDNDRVGEYMEDELAELVYPYIEEIDLGDYKIDLGEPASLEDLVSDYGPDAEGEDDVPEIDDSPAITKRGDLFLLGEHRLLCGDATDEGDVKRLMGGKKADMVFTDPPYGINYKPNHNNKRAGNYHGAGYHNVKKQGRIIGDEQEYNPIHLFKTFGYVKELFIWGVDYFVDKIKGFKDGSLFVWNKRYGIEDIKFNTSHFELCWSKKNHLKEIINVKWFGIQGTEKQDIRNRIHPTQKPLELCEWFINKFSKKNQIIWDGFLGSGTTLIACEKLNRKCYGMEIEPKYCDVIIKRFSDYADISEESIRKTVQHA